MSKFFLKISLLGDGAVGKTSLRERFMGRGFRKEHMMTIGADFAAYDRVMSSTGGEQYQTTFQIWDMAGQDTFQSVRSRFFKGSMGALCVFDVTRRDSFLHMTQWIEELWRNNGRGVIPITILGNKADIRDRNSVSAQEAQRYADAISANTQAKGFNVVYMDTSAKEGLNVENSFDTLGLTIIDMLKSGSMRMGG